MKFRQLRRTGIYVSVLSYGGSALSNLYDGYDERRGIHTVHTALDMGINLFDTSPFYGHTTAESTLGKALQGIYRDDYLLATKVGRYGFGEADFDYSAKCVQSSIDESLARLQVDHVDFIQVHDAEFAELDQLVHETIPALRHAQQAGKARFVGITGLPIQIFRDVIECVEVDQVQSYCHYCLNDTALLDLLPELDARDVIAFNAAPFAMRLLNMGTLPDWHPAPEELRIKCAEAAQYCSDHGSDIAKLALQFSASNSDVPTTIVGTANPDRVRKYIEHISEPIDEELLREVLEILKPIHNLSWASGKQKIA